METKRKILNRYRQGEKINAISKKMNISRNTVKKVIRSNGTEENGYALREPNYPVLGEYIKVLEKLLRENKNCHRAKTARKLYEELQMLGYSGSETSVSRYITKWKSKNESISKTACVPLCFEPGEAYQFDWSNEKIILCNEVIEVKVAHFVLCHSRKKFLYIYPNEKQEMVLDAHIKAFNFFAGTPIRGIYDNMTTAVKKVLSGKEREWNDDFERLCAHYLIEPTACTPGRGNEKGRVERQVQIDRQEFFTPMPKGNSLAEINELLLSRLISYNKNHQHPEHKNKTIEEVYEEEKKYFIEVQVEFDGFKEKEVKVSSTCLARYDRNDYSVDCSCAGKIVQCRSYADKLVFIYEGQKVAEHERRFTKGKTYYNCLHYLPILKYKPGALRNGAPFVNMDLPDELQKVKQYMHSQKNGSRDFAHILSYIASESMESVVLACSKAIKEKTISKDVIVNLILRHNDTKDGEIPEDKFQEKRYPQITITVDSDCSKYNKLLSNQEEA